MPNSQLQPIVAMNTVGLNLGLTMSGRDVSLAEMVVTGMSTVDGERFFVGRRVQGHITEDDAATEECSFPPELSAPTRAALEAVGITPYAPMCEASLREKLGRLGLPEPKIDHYFAEARKWITHVSTVWPPQH